MTESQVAGNLPQIIRNDDDLYEGNLVYYFVAIFNKAKNLKHPYHNFRHMFHVLWLCYQACAYYISKGMMTKREARNLLVAAMFHDFDHSGLMGDDDLNIARAIRGFLRNIDPYDLDYSNDIVQLIKWTEYPYAVPSEQISLCGQILRDADVSQALNPAWLQQVVFGLSTEWNTTPLEILKKQGPFCNGLVFHTEWGKQMFSEDKIKEKVQEATELLEILEGTKTVST